MHTETEVQDNVAAAETQTAAPTTDKPKRAPRKPAAKKTKAKAKPAPKKAAKTTSTLTDADNKMYDEVFAAWKKGGEDSRICNLQKKVEAHFGKPVRRGAIRRQIRKRAECKSTDGKTVLKGREAFKALRTRGAGGLRSGHGAPPKKANMDEGVERITIAQRKKEGWTSRNVTPTKGERFPVLTTKSGMEYRAAKATEKADYLVEMGNGLPDKRVVVYATAEGVVSK